MKIYDSPHDLAADLGWKYEVYNGHGVDGFPGEADWGIYRAAGLGSPDTGGWLVTFASPRPARTLTRVAEGCLIAYEVLGDEKGRGRALRLSGVISGETEEQLLERAKQQPWWPKERGDRLVDIETIAEWVARQVGFDEDVAVR